MGRRARFLLITDLECSGTRPEDNHEILQIARVIYDMKAKRVVPDSDFMAYVRPTQWESRDADALLVNRLGDKQFLLDRGLKLSQALYLWSKNIDWNQSVVAAWGIDFESRFLANAYGITGRDIPYPYQMVDLRTLAWWALGCREVLSLGDVAGMVDVPYDIEQAHDAMYDVQCEAKILDICIGGSNGSRDFRRY